MKPVTPTLTPTEPLDFLIEALRQELQEYGEMLARLDEQQDSIMRRAADDVLTSVSSIQNQGVALQAARDAREEARCRLARSLRQPEQATFAELTTKVPANYRPLLSALVDENNQLLVRIQQRVRQNHLLLRRSLDLMQQFLHTLAPAENVTVYNAAGCSLANALPASVLYDAAG